MATIGGEDLLKKYGSPLAVAEALILGKLYSDEQRFASELVSILTLEAARIRLEAKGLLNEKNIK